MAKKRKKLNYFQRLILTYRIRIKRFLNNQKKNPKKYRLSSNVKLAGISIILIIVVFFVGKNMYLNYRISTQTNLGYTKAQAQYILDNNLNTITKKYGYSENFIESHMNNAFDEKYLELYFALNKVDDTTKMYYDKLSGKGYTLDEIQKIITKIDKEDYIIALLIYDKQEDIDKYILNYTKNKITKDYLNIYENTTLLDKIDITSIINKKTGLTANFIPENLTNISKYCAFNSGQLTQEAANSFNSMCMDAKEQGIYFASMIAYRSYSDQENIYNSYVNNYGELQVDSYTPKPGYSEHQTGLAVNVSSMASYPEGTSFVDTNEYQWLLLNADKYGFIFRYPKGKEYITGFESEPGHLRYVGEELAQLIAQTDYTMEEFAALYLSEEIENEEIESK